MRLCSSIYNVSEFDQCRDELKWITQSNCIKNSRWVQKHGFYWITFQISQWECSIWLSDWNDWMYGTLVRFTFHTQMFPNYSVKICYRLSSQSYARSLRSNDFLFFSSHSLSHSLINPFNSSFQLSRALSFILTTCDINLNYDIVMNHKHCSFPLPPECVLLLFLCSQ